APHTPLLLPVNLSGRPFNDLLAVDPTTRELRLLAGGTFAIGPKSTEHAAVVAQGERLDSYHLPAASTNDLVALLPMRLNSDAVPDLVLLKADNRLPTVALSPTAMTFTVTNTSDSGPGSLVQAITDANTNSGADTIAFNIPGTAPYTINAVTDITDTVTIDGTTQPGFSGRPLIVVPSLTSNVGNGVVRGLVIKGSVAFRGTGLGNSCIVEGNFIGTDATGTSAVQGGGVLGSGTAILVGGTTSAARNIIVGFITGSGNPGGGSLTMKGNYVGSDVTGQVALASSSILVSGGLSSPASGQIGGTAAGERNLILGGISTIGNNTQVNVVGNYIGTDVTGSTSLLTSGISFSAGTINPSNNVLAGTITIDFGLTPTVADNYIGVDATGTHALSGNSGITVTDRAPSTVITRNIIVGTVLSNATNVSISNNHIGTNATGTAALGGGGVSVSHTGIGTGAIVT